MRNCCIIVTFFTGGIIFLIFLYVDFFNFSIDLVVENMDIHLNIAQLVPVGLSSILSFVAIIMGGLVIVITIYGAVSVFWHMMSFITVIKVVTYMCVLLSLVSYMFSLYTNFWDCFLSGSLRFYWLLTGIY